MINKLFSSLSSVLAQDVVSHPLAFILGLLLLPLLAGTTVGASLLPFATQNQVAELSATLTQHMAAEQQRIEIISQWQCEVQVSAEMASLESQLRTIDQERWTLQGVVDKGEGTQRDRDRLGTVLTDKETIARRLQRAMTKDCSP